MPDEEGFSFAGELNVGGYGAGEMDLGVPVRGLAGFGRELEGSVRAQERFCDDGSVDGYEQVFGSVGVVTGAYSASQVSWVWPEGWVSWEVFGWQTS